ncbi:family 4 putative carbohydrate esterase [Triangularia verruculosa]|uniref:Family 4 putative carbohydrate esterase n=1 Tax=Triangularia verruculosa TaxID=2587418 RepID=A0AAN6XQB3_9PEZI|nr:family 4 putative carbohydrate esterase [Triangularia verruculosa]
MSQPPPPSSRWPPPYKAAVSFTMDNLGEAQDVLNGKWPHPIGTHPAVTNQLPRMLSLLDKHNIKATYFAESWSLSVYPDAIKSLQRAGHEVAWHGYQHEVWKDLSAEAEQENFDKSWEAADKAGIEYEGFRPPGGSINDRTWGMLREHGVKYVSPLGELGAGKKGVVTLPFEWRGVDAFWYMDKFSGIRKDHGEKEKLETPEEDFKRWLLGKIEEIKETGGYLSVLFHPFLQTTEDRFAVLEEVLGEIATEEDIWVANCKEVASWVSEHPDLFEARMK